MQGGCEAKLIFQTKNYDVRGFGHFWLSQYIGSELENENKLNAKKFIINCRMPLLGMKLEII